MKLEEKSDALQAFKVISHAPFLSGYPLAPFIRHQGSVTESGPPLWQHAGSRVLPPLFSLIAAPSLAELLERSVRSASPQIERTPAGLFFFAVPLDCSTAPSCLVGGGARDSAIDLVRVEELARMSERDPIALLEELETMPVVTIGEVSEVTGRTMALVRMLLDRDATIPASSCEKLLGIVSELAKIDDNTTLCQTLLDRSAELVSAESGSLMLRESGSEVLTIAAARGMHSGFVRGLSLSMGKGIAGQVASNGRPVLVIDIGSDGRFAVGHRPRFKTGSFVSLPILCKGETLGVLNLADRTDHLPFSAHDLDILTQLVGHVSPLIRRARSYEGISRLERLTVTDPLTEVYNRRFLERRIEEELSRSSRYGLPLSIMMLDLDSFKLYNDLCGHQAGDGALQAVAKILCRSVREMDIVTRFGGEEFCILLPDTPHPDAMYVAERIRYGIEHELFRGEEELPLGRLTVSIGIASFPDNGTTSADLILSADVALYQAKGEGRNRIVNSADLPQEGGFRGFTSHSTIRIH